MRNLAAFDFLLYEDETAEVMAMVERPERDVEFNNNILRAFYKGFNLCD